MIQFTTLQNFILSQDVVESFYTIRIIGPHIALRLSNYFNNVTIASEVYIGNKAILSVEPPRISTTVDREQYTIVLSDPEFEYANLASEGVTGAQVEVRLVLIHPTTKEPVLNIDETFILYKGQLDYAKYKADLSEIGENTISIVCASPLADLEATKPFYTSKTFMREKVSASDSSFDQVYQGSGKIRLKWGKI